MGIHITGFKCGRSQVLSEVLLATVIAIIALVTMRKMYDDE